MSRLGKTPIALPKGVEVNILQGKFSVKGPKGQIELAFDDTIGVSEKDQWVTITSNGATSAVHGLYRSLIKNAILGVFEGFEKRIVLVGVGYRAAVSGNLLDMQMGFSHPTKLSIPNGLKVTVDDKGTEILIAGINKHQVGQFAAQARAIRPPEPYKGKGARYKDEHVRKKAGKSATKGKGK